MELNGTLREYDIDVLFAVYLSFLTPSVVGSFSVLVVSILRWRHLKEQVYLLVQLALADLLAALTLVFSTILNKENSGYSVTLCQYSLPLALTFYFISFLLVVVYAWRSKKAIHGWRAAPADESGVQSEHMVVLVCSLVWLVPISLYLTYVLTPFIKVTPLLPDNEFPRDMAVEKYCRRCIMFLHVSGDPCPDADERHDTLMRVILVFIVVLVMFSCSVIYYKVGKWYKAHEHQGLFPVEGDGRSRKRFKSMFSTARNMVMVIMVCWTPALLLILVSLIRSKHTGQSGLFALYVLQAATVSLQGFLNSMVYAWRRQNFTEAVLGERTPLLFQHRLPFFEESLKIPF